MAIIYKKGNIIHAEETYIMHGCNAQGKMGSGVAKAIRDRWPEVYPPYKAYCERDSAEKGYNLLGTVYAVLCEDKMILNAISQQFYGYSGDKYVSYDAIDLIMQELTSRLAPGTAIAMSRIGSSLGGGDWDIISKIIENRQQDLKITVYDL